MNRLGLSLAVTVVGLADPAVAVVINVPGDFATIQGAIDAAVSGDEIVVAPGTYNEIISNFGIVRSSHGPDVTIIDGSGFNFSVVTCTTGCGVLEGFTITGGNAPTSLGGGWYNQNSSPTVINCKFVGNNVRGNGLGGAMRNSNSHPTLIDCTFTGNTATNGGAIFNSVNSFPTITNCFFGGNSNNAITNANGALPVITDSLFCENAPNDIVGPWDDNGGNEFSGDCDDWCPSVSLRGEPSLGYGNGNGEPTIVDHVAVVQDDRSCNLVVSLATRTCSPEGVL